MRVREVLLTALGKMWTSPHYHRALGKMLTSQLYHRALGKLRTSPLYITEVLATRSQ
jgi:hypothetical protein